MTLAASFDGLASRRVLLFGGKGGVGKTTLSAAAALHFSESRPTILFTTDPASNLADLFGDHRQPATGNLTLETLDAESLYARFLTTNLESFITLGDRGTYLDRDELRRFFELSLPGVDELMAWMRIGELAEEHPESMVVVDTAPTGHTLRMLSSGGHFRQVAAALDAMQEKHRDMVRQFTRRDVRDALDTFIDEFDSSAKRRRELLTDPARAAFLPVTLSERWVVEQTQHLMQEVRAEGIDVPFAILNRAVLDADCARDRERATTDADARTRLGATVDAPRSCTPLDSAERIAGWLRASATLTHRSRSGGQAPSPVPPATISEGQARAPVLHTANTLADPHATLLFLAGKGGVGKTTTAASIALQLAAAHPDQRFTVLSVDPAHTLPAVFASEAPPPNLAVETIDTRARWRTFRDSIGGEIERAVDAITPRGMSVAYDTEALRKLIEIAPPGADELFAITRLADLLADESQSAIVVDTAPTGHFLRLLDLPQSAGEWVREFMRILLRYRDLVPAGSLGEELVRASRSLHALTDALHSERAAVVVVTRPERIVVEETERLLAELQRRGIRVAGVVANAVTPANDCACDRSLRAFELQELARLGDAVIVVERRDQPPAALADIASLLHFGP